MKRILITGSTDGIGKATALAFAIKGNHIIIHGRNIEKVEEIVNWIKDKSNNDNIDYFVADFNSLDEVEKAAIEVNEKFEYLDILINNAATITPEFIESENNNEMTFQVNQLAPFMFTLQLIPLLKQKKTSQIVNIASISHAETLDFNQILDKKHFDPFRAYEISKLANILFTYKLSNRLLKDQILVNTLHPGVISTKLLHVLWSGGDNVSEAVKVVENVISQAEKKNVSGKYFVGKSPSKSSAISYDENIQDKMWAFCMNLLKK